MYSIASWTVNPAHEMRNELNSSKGKGKRYNLITLIRKLVSIQRSTLPFPVRTQFRVPDLLKKAAEQFAAVLDSQFLIHMRAVRFHRVFADDQGRCNLPVAFAAQEECTHLPLLPGERAGSWDL